MRRKLARRARPLEIRHLTLPHSPTMEQGLIVRLQDRHAGAYLDALSSFIEGAVPYYFQDKPSLPFPSDSESFHFFSDLFQAMVVIGASRSEEQILEASDLVLGMTGPEGREMPDYAPEEARLILNRLFYQAMYEFAFIDELNFKIRIPSFRYRMKNGQTLAYTPSFPLYAFSLQLCEEAGVTREVTRRLIENFCIFYWNLHLANPEVKEAQTSRYRRKLEQELKKLEPGAPGTDLLDFIQTTMNDVLFFPDRDDDV